MKSKILKLIVILFSISINIGLAFAGKIDHFNVTVNPEKAGVGEAIDLTIEAVDKNDNIVKDYEGTVLIFSESDREAQFPNALEDNSYTFKKSNEGLVKFENAVKFNNKGENDIHVYDLDDQTDSLMGLATVEITDKVVKKKVDISILSPETGLTVGNKSITVSGKTVKNHQVKIVLNGKEEILTTSNEDGIFEKKVDNLQAGENIIKAFVLDGDDKELGASKEVKISINSNLPIFNKLKLTPNGDTEIEAETNIIAEVYASKGLEKVAVIIDDSMNELIEDTPGVYKGEFLAPKRAGEYKVDVLLKDELGHKAEEKAKAVIKIKEKTQSAAEPIPEPVVTPAPTPTPEPVVTPAPSPEPVTTPTPATIPKPEKDKCIQGDYSGNVYDGECGTKPVDYSAPVDLGIKNLRIVELKTKTILTWDYLPDAEKYDVYKKTINGLELIQSVKEPKFEFYMSGDQIKYEYFAVKAIGKQVFTNESGNKITKLVEGDLTQAVKIQTGPTEILLVLLALLLGFIVVIFTRKKA